MHAGGNAEIDVETVAREHHKMQMELVKAISRTQGTIADRLKALESLIFRKGGVALVNMTSQSLYVRVTCEILIVGRASSQLNLTQQRYCAQVLFEFIFQMDTCI